MLSWDKFIIDNNGSFLQSYNWGEFQKKTGRKVWRIEREGLEAQIIKHALPFNKSYLYIPRGPVLKGEISQDEQRDRLNYLLEEVLKIAKNERSVFCKIEPEIDYPFSSLSFNIKSNNRNIQPRKTQLLGLSWSEESIFSQMHHKARYNVRLSKKKGVDFKEVEYNDKTIDTFWDLLSQTAERGGFATHPKKHYETMCDFLTKIGLVKIFFAEYKNKVIAANLVCFFGNTATYLHGASAYEYRKLMAPYLLQWGSILEAKKKGMEYYDFWGVNTEAWGGITHFKKRFGGKEVAYPYATDMVIRPLWYQAYKLGRKFL